MDSLPFGPFPLVLVAVAAWIYVKTLIRKDAVSSSVFYAPLFLAAFACSGIFAPFADTSPVLVFTSSQLLTPVLFVAMLKVTMSRARSGRKKVFIPINLDLRTIATAVVVLLLGIFAVNALLLRGPSASCTIAKCAMYAFIFGDLKEYYVVLFLANIVTGIALVGFASLAAALFLKSRSTHS